jgi:hypothetical protein
MVLNAGSGSTRKSLPSGTMVQEAEINSEVQSRRQRVMAAGAVLSLVAAAMLVFGAASRSWWTGSADAMDYGVGPRGFEICMRGSCTARGLSDLGEKDRSWERIGMATFAAGIGAAVLLAIAAVAGFRGRGRLASRVAAGSTLFASALGVAFVFLFPDGFAGAGGVSPGPGMVVYLLGGALGTGAAAVLLPPPRR